MESDGERYAALRARDATVDGSGFDDDDDDRSPLDTSVIGNSSTGGAHARVVPLTEPYGRYKSIELRAECYRRGTRPTRSGPKVNDNKAGYMALLRTYDLTQDVLDSKGALLSANHSLLRHQPYQQVQQVTTVKAAKKRKLPSLQNKNAEDSPSVKSTPATAALITDGLQHASTAKRQSHSPSYEEEDTEEQEAPSRVSTVQTAASAVNGTNPATPAVMLLPCDPQLATEYVQLKMQLLLESREIEKTNRLEGQRFKLHAELRGVIATLAQLHGLAKEYYLEHDTVLLADVKQDIAYFMEQRRKLKLEVGLLDRYR